MRFRIGIAAVRSLAFTRQGRETVTLKVPADLPTTRGGDRTFVASIPRGLVGRKGTLVTVKDANGDPVGASAANFPDTDATHYDIVISRVSR